MQHRIAFVVPAFNRGESLLSTFNSILDCVSNAKISPDIIISIDDYEFFPYKKTLDSISYSNLKLIKQKKLGLKNHILKLGDLTFNYDYIIILEDDVVVNPYLLSFLLPLINNNSIPDNVAAISLYNFEFGDFTNYPIDVSQHSSFWNYVQSMSSWGQVIWKSKWIAFKSFLNQSSFDFQSLPHQMQCWSQNSWKKLYNLWLLENDLFVMFPSKALSTTTNGKNGTHIKEHCYNSSFSNLHIKHPCNHYHILESAVYYDHFLELNLSKSLLLPHYLMKFDIESDLCGLKSIKSFNKRFILTLRKQKKFIFSWSLKNNSVFYSLYKNTPGHDLFLVKKEDYLRGNLNYFSYIKIVPFLNYRKHLLYLLLYIIRRIYKQNA